MTKKPKGLSGAAANAATSARVLRVQAEGAQNIAAGGGILSIDKKPDPYVTFALDKVIRVCDAVEDVEPLAFFKWPNAVAEFAVDDSMVLEQMSLFVHVKDKDLLKDRYIGGTRIELGTFLTGSNPTTATQVLCSSKMFPLEFADENFKKKKQSGEVQLTIALIDKRKPDTDLVPPVGQPTKAKASPTATIEQGAKTTTSASLSEPPKSQSQPETTQTNVLAEAQTKPDVGPASDVPSSDTVAVQPKDLAIISNAPLTITSPTSLAATKEEEASPKQQTTGNLVTVAKEEVSSDKEKLQSNLTHTTPQLNSVVSSTPATMTSLTIELVSAQNLTRPATLGALFDRKPDPFVTVEFYGMSRTSTALKDVNLSKPVQWTNTMLTFELPMQPPPMPPRKGIRPMDLLIHVKDENLLKPTYMGGAKADIDEFFLPRGANQEWYASPTAVSGTEKTFPLVYSDERLSKKKPCGEITLRFHLGITTSSEESMKVNEGHHENITSGMASVPLPLEQQNLEQNKTSEMENASSTANLEAITAIAQQVPSPTTPPMKQLSNDIRMLSVEALCGRNLIQPRGKKSAKGMLKSIFDRKPDPYVTFVLGGHTRKCPSISNVDVAFFEWKNAVQVFEFIEKPYPSDLVVHIRDEDSVGEDPYMGGTRIMMNEIWDRVAQTAGSSDTELVKDYSLMFTDPDLTRQKRCGEITLRFRWVYADNPLPIVTTTNTTDLRDEDQAKDTQGTETTAMTSKIYLGYLFLRKMVVSTHPKLLDTSFDLYIEAATVQTTVNSRQICATSRILVDATKGMDSNTNARVEWDGDELVLPVIALDGGAASQVKIALKDRNAITKDTQLAEGILSLSEFIASNVDQAASVEIELELVGSKLKKTPKTNKDAIKLEVNLQFLTLGSSQLICPLSSGVVLTFYLLRSNFYVDTLINQKSDTTELSSYSISIDTGSKQSKSSSFLSFGKREAEAQTNFMTLNAGNDTIEWMACFDIKYSNKQIQSAKENEALDIDLQVHRAEGKHGAATVGSIQLNVWSLVHNNTGTTIREKISFGALGSMEVEFTVSYRLNIDDITIAKTLESTGKSTLVKSAPQILSGNLHLLVINAQNLVSPNAQLEKAEDLDPEVRIAIEPRYIKRKDNPVRSMLKTRPLENAGVKPVWNEYLRLEYRLPAPSESNSVNTTSSEEFPLFPAPIVQFGIYDIQIPGERGGSVAIGKAEIPLSAFVAAEELNPITMTIDLYLSAKKTGSLSVCGIFEPLVDQPSNQSVENNQESYKSRCRRIGRTLRDQAKLAKYPCNESNIVPTSRSITTETKAVPGRIEIHLMCARGIDFANCDGSVTAHIWISSCLDDRRELKSNLHSSNNLEGAQPSDIVWNVQTTLYASNIVTDLLRLEILTSTGKSAGSLKLPLGSFQAYPMGQTIHEWYPLVLITPSVSISKLQASSSNAVMLGVSLYPDQLLFRPLEHRRIPDADERSVSILLRCGRFFFANKAKSDEKASTTKFQPEMTEIACKFVLIGGVISLNASCCTTFQSISVENMASCVKWNEHLTIGLESLPSDIVANSFIIGTCPMLRMEILMKRKNARFQELIVSADFSLVALLSNIEKGKVSKWWPLYILGNKTEPSLVGILELDVVLSSLPSPGQVDMPKVLNEAPCLNSLSGVLCIRCIAGRNLTDVDVNGEQDPYVVIKTNPFSAWTTIPCLCQTGISLNGGRHPQWNSPVYQLRIYDVLTDYLRLEALDSNEEDHLPDAYIGAVNIAIYSLFQDELDGQLNMKGKTKWCEAWVPIYPVLRNDAGNGTNLEDIEEKMGEIRVEYRFLSQEYFEKAHNLIEEQTIFSPCTKEIEMEETIATELAGSFFFHIVQAKQLPCTKGMQPGVRLVCASLGFAHVTKVGKESIHDPVWDTEIIEMEVSKRDIAMGLANINVEIVDLAVRTANPNAMAVITFGFINVDTFASHPTAISYAYYPLGCAREMSTQSERMSCILMGCQFIPKSKREHITPLQRDITKATKSSRGQLHIKVVQSRFDLPSFFEQNMLNKKQTLRFKLIHGESIYGNAVALDDKCLVFPPLLMNELLKSDGCVKWGSSVSDTEESGYKNVLLFDCDTSHEKVYEDNAGSFVVNPILICELVVQTSNVNKDAGDEEELVIGELEIPIFDFILFDGHLASSWYAFSNLSQTAPRAKYIVNKNCQKCGEIKMEVQYLPSLSKLPESTSASPVQDITVICVEVKEARKLSVSPHEPCVVWIELLGCQAETKPSVLSSSKTLLWNENLEFPLLQKPPPSSAAFVMKIEIRNTMQDNEIIGTCNWVLPQKLVVMDAIAKDEFCDELENLVVKILPKTNTLGASTHCELHLAVRRQVLVNTKQIPQPTRLLTDTCNQGVIYLWIEAEPEERFKGSTLVAVFKQPSISPQTIAEAFQEYFVSATLKANLPLNWSDVKILQNNVIKVDESLLRQNQSLIILASQELVQHAGTPLYVKQGNQSTDENEYTIEYVELDSHTLSSLIQSPRIDISHRLSVRAIRQHLNLDKTRQEFAPNLNSFLSLRLRYVDILHGQIVVYLKNLFWPCKATPPTKLSLAFRMEMRLLSSTLQWFKSSLGKLNLRSNEIEWNQGNSPTKLFYSNENETTEPILQLVLFRVEESSPDESGVREAFGQISLLNIITADNQSNEKRISVQIEMTRMKLDPDNDDPAILKADICFASEICNVVEEKNRLAKEKEEMTLTLAEGTAELKKAFGILGGDEDTQVKINALKMYLLQHDQNAVSGNDNVRSILQRAADLETDGDLDKLFTAMDVNGDGMLSWDEYAGYMQNVYALADAAHTQHLLAKSAKKQSDEIDGEEENATLEVAIVKEDELHDNSKDSMLRTNFLSSYAKQLPASKLDEEEILDAYTSVPPLKQNEPALPLILKSAVREERVECTQTTQRVVSTKHISASDTPMLQSRKETVIPEAVISKQKRRPVLNPYVLDWKVDDVVQWLAEEMELGQYTEAIIKNAVNGKLLLTLRPEELESELGITVPLHKRKLMNQIAEWQEKFGYVQPLSLAQRMKKKEKPRRAQPTETTIVEATPSFIKREQLVYQTKLKFHEDKAQSSGAKTLKIGTRNAKMLHTTTSLIQDRHIVQAQRNNDDKADQGETFADAMQDVLESVRPHTPPHEEAPVTTTASTTSMPMFPVIQIGNITNTDELFEIVKQRIHQLSQQLLPLSKDERENLSDFGDMTDDIESIGEEDKGEEQTGLQLVFNAFARSQTSKISRAKFQEGLGTLLQIDVPWHQFDLLFHRLDVDCDGDLSFDEFQQVFQQRYASFHEQDLLFLQDALANFVIDRLETQQWTLGELFRAFDRDGGGNISIAEFSTLVRFLFTQQSKRTIKAVMKKRHIYLLMSCLDLSADRRISQQEFLRFFFIIWSTRLMEVQDQLFAYESNPNATSTQDKEIIAVLQDTKRKMRKALRTNFSRPFRDAMRCLDVNTPSPFSGLLSKLQLLPPRTSVAHHIGGDTQVETAGITSEEDKPLQIWQVLQGETSTSHLHPHSMAALLARSQAKVRDESKQRVQRGKNQVLRTKLIRQREPERANAILQTPNTHIQLDSEAKLKFDYRNQSK